MDTPRRICFYIRVSTDKQHTDNQLRDLLAYCRARKWPEPEADSIYTDVITGSSDSREQLDKMMALLKRHRYDCLLVWHFDRFARGTIHAIMTMHELNLLGINFVSQQQGIDTTTPIGKAMYGISAIFAELELTQIKERVNAGIRRAQSCKNCDHAKHRDAACACGCEEYEPLKYTGRSGWKKASSKRGPGVIAQEVRDLIRLAGSQGQSQREIARAVGVSQGTVCKVLNFKPPS
jgi:DNA invertase Pin-like site-specific DNA recombinase